MTREDVYAFALCIPITVLVLWLVERMEPAPQPLEVPVAYTVDGACGGGR